MQGVCSVLCSHRLVPPWHPPECGKCLFVCGMHLTILECLVITHFIKERMGGLQMGMMSSEAPAAKWLM